MTPAAICSGVVKNSGLSGTKRNIACQALAATGRTDDRQELAFLNLHVEGVERGHRRAVWRAKSQLDVAGLDIGGHQ